MKSSFFDNRISKLEAFTEKRVSSMPYRQKYPGDAKSVKRISEMVQFLRIWKKVSFNQSWLAPITVLPCIIYSLCSED